MSLFAFLVLLPMLGSAPVAAEEDGARAFTPCRACHSLDPVERGLPGPNLSGVVGRSIGGDSAFDYSPVLRKARDDGLRWDAQRLQTFLADPAARCFLDCGCRCAGSRIPPNGRRWCGFSPIQPRVDG